MEAILAALSWLDRHTAAGATWLTAVLAVYVLASSAEDVLLDLLWLLRRGRKRTAAPPVPARERRIVIMVPLWREAEVIGRMLEHNVSAIRYENYEILAGVYANDAETRQAVERAAARLDRVSLAEIPHDGPTSKADCLNWIYQRLLERENQGAPRAEIVLIHDAEDLVHPDSLERINRHADEAGMIQAPVLAMPTPLRELTHGLYCDDFAEGQMKDLAVRTWLGAFLPGCGVGTAFRREELERLAEAESNRLFDPLSLTEDYDNGLRLFRMGCRQMLLPVETAAGGPVATREYFPRRFHAAVRQRTRWITGNSLQAWQRHGWGSGMRKRWVQAWFLWRDRKGLWGSWTGLACNLLLLWAGFCWLAARVSGAGWWYPEAVAHAGWLAPVLAANLALCCERLGVRMYCSSRIYGWRFALGAPLRVLWGNLINALASGRAAWQFLQSQWTGRPLRWLKTEHYYPSLESLRAWTGGGWAADPAAGAAPVSGQLARPFPVETAEASGGSASGRHDRVCVGELGFAAPSRRLSRALPANLGEELGVVPAAFCHGRLEVLAARALTEGELARIHRMAGAPVRIRRASTATVRSLLRWRDAPPAPFSGAGSSILCDASRLSREDARGAPPPSVQCARAGSLP